MLVESSNETSKEVEKCEESVPDCCKAENERKKSGALTGLVYGLVPHAGCIAFIAASVLGVTVATEFFKPLLLNPHFFYALIALSLVFATISAALYLRRRGALSLAGVKRSWKYLSVLYGTTLAVNLLLFMVVFPLAANYVSAQPVQLQANQPPTSAACGLQVEGSTACPAGVSGVSSASSASLTRQSSLAKLTLQVDIPCPGHAPLISGELKKLPGMRSVQFRFANYFDVEYDSAQVTQTRILGLDVFKTYAAKIVS